MKQMKRTGIYKASNVTFDPSKIEAFSYGWWRFVGVVEGKVVFNNARYSNSTSKHQYKVRRLMKELGIKIDIEMPLEGGIIFEGEHRYSYGVCTEGKSLGAMILEAEEYLCDEFLYAEDKRIQRNERAKARREAAKAVATVQRPALSLVEVVS